MRVVVAAIAALAALGAGAGRPSFAQAVDADDVAAFVRTLQRAVQEGNLAAHEALLGTFADPERVAAFVETELQPGITRAVIQERDRHPLSGVALGDGYRLVVDAFEQSGARARVATWAIEIVRADTAIGEAWQIADEERLSAVEPLYQLALDPGLRFAARNLRIRDKDFELVLTDGVVFVSRTEQGTTAAVLTGRGVMTFRPGPEAERGQVKIFSGAEALETPFDAVYLRINPGDAERLLSSSSLVPEGVDVRDLGRADKVFREESSKSYGVELGDLSSDSWFLLPHPGDVVAEVRTKRFGTLTYTHSSSEPEDISLVDRKRQKTIALYSSRDDAMGLSETEENERAGYEVLHYDIDVSATPARQWIEAQASMRMRVRARSISNFTLRLADPLVVHSIVSDEYGRLFGMRVKNQNSIVVNLPATLPQGEEFTVTFVYAGRLPPQARNSEMLARQQPSSLPPMQADDIFVTDPEPNFLYSSRSGWYPEPTVGGFSTANLRITIPAGLACVASGEREAGSPVLVPGSEPSLARQRYTFTAQQPLRYLAFIVSRFATARTVSVDARIPAASAAVPDPAARSVIVSVEANPRQMTPGKSIGDRAADITRFYQLLLADAPYPTFTVALVESNLPGGHSPGYFAAINQTLAASPRVWRNDPVAFEGYPDYVLAHEIAHQWWGQAVGWRNYREQWLSEGVAQYFAALYAKQQRGEKLFADMMRQMGKWAKDESDEGPISLGYRLGHLRGDDKVFRAIVYNKSAVVLHMLRQLTGDEAFFRGLRSFYQQSRFRNVSTAEFRAAMETATGRPLSRFFDRWINGSTLPQLKLAYRTEGADLVLHVEQVGDLFDLPLTVTVQYADKPSTTAVVPVTDRVVEVRTPLAGTLRAVDISKDDISLARVSRN